MLMHNQRLQYPARVAAPMAGLANLPTEQLSGAQGESGRKN